MSVPSSPVTSPYLQLLVLGRGEGKTTQAFNWLSHGVRTSGSPGWSRVLVVRNHRIEEFHRQEYWTLLEDYSHRVYDLETWLNARDVNNDTEVCIDDLDLVLFSRIPAGFPGRLVTATITADPWPLQTFKERTSYTS